MSDPDIFNDDDNDPKIFSSDDDEVGEDIEEVEEEEEEVQTKKKKRRRTGVSAFIEDEAAVDEDEDEEEEAEDGFPSDQEEEIVEKRNRHRQLDSRSKALVEEDAQVIADRMRERHGRAELNEFRGDIEHVPQALLLPSVNDPKLWMVRCKPGAEKNAIMTISRKFFGLQGSDRPLKILSVFSRDSLKGYLYLEAEKQAHVQEAIERVTNVYASKLQLVPVNEMADCLRVKAQVIELKKGAWIRIKRGKYAGDLGQVLEVSDTGENAVIKLIPRLDHTAKGFGEKRKSSDIRIPQKLFSVNDVNKKDFSLQQGGYVYQNEFFDKEGYLEKTIKMSTIETKAVNPTLEEITKFSGGVMTGRGEELNVLASANLAKGGDFQTGEKVIVLSGEMKNVTGVVYSIEGGIITITPDQSFGLGDRVKYPAEQLAKWFSKGDHVRVMNGVHKGESGTTLKTEQNVVTILSDSSLKTLQIFSKDLRSAQAVSSIPQSNSQFLKHDFVQLSPTQVGVVVEIENDNFVLLDPFGNIFRAAAREIRSRRDTSRAVTSDINGDPVSAKDPVVILDDNSSTRKQAIVLHVYRTSVYCHSKDVSENGGVFVVKNNQVALIGKKGNDGQLARTFVRPHNKFKDPLLAATVNIIQGPYKGYLGIVKDTTETTARVELHTNNRVITIEKSKLKSEKDPKFSRPVYRSDSIDRNIGRTPAYNAGAKTPAYGDVGGRTPAWDAGSRTPAPSWDRGGTNAWDAGSRTPAPGSARTPAGGLSSYNRYNAETPSYATTPGVYDSAETATPYTTNTPYNNPNTPYGATPGGDYLHMATTTPAVAVTPAAVATPAPIGTDYDNTAKRSSEWLESGIVVRIQPGFRDGSYDNFVGDCISIDNGVAIIKLSNGDVVTTDDEFLKPMLPEKKGDRVKILSGDNKGKLANLLSIDLDVHEGLIKIDENEEIVMVSLDQLAKLVK